jgi:hypothetical protein
MHQATASTALAIASLSSRASGVGDFQCVPQFSFGQRCSLLDSPNAASVKREPRRRGKDRDVA